MCHTSRERRGRRDDGVLAGFHADVPPAAVGRPIQALVAVQLRPKSRDAVEGFRDAVVDLPGVLDVFVVSGSDDFLLRVCVADPSGLEAFVLDHVASQPHVADVRTSLVYETRSSASMGVARLLADDADRGPATGPPAKSRPG